MGREIRRVPKDWQHPKDSQGSFVPMYDQDFKSAAQEWKDNFLKWESGEDPKKAEYPELEFWEWNDNPPDPESYRPKFEADPICYQVYETVTEGTPVSPVFDTQEQIIEWLVVQGHSLSSAKKFVEHGWAPSFMGIPGVGLISGIDAYDYDKESDND